jgi:hypothetical protein
MTTYNVCEYRAYQVIFGSEKQYAVYEDIEGEKNSYMIALFRNKDEAEQYAERKNAHGKEEV